MELIELLKQRFDSHPLRHQNVSWEEVSKRLDKEKLSALSFMEESGGEPDVVCFGDLLCFCDCSKESPKGRRSVCYDEAARLSRKKNAPSSSALEQATAYGIQLLDFDLYQKLQGIEEFDLSTSSWILAPEDIRNKGGALFCEKRYGHVFVFHNGADSYYSNRGWRGYIIL